MTNYEEIDRKLSILDGVHTNVARFQGVHFVYAFVVVDGEFFYITETRKKCLDGDYKFNYWLLCNEGPKLIGSSVKSKFEDRIVRKDLFLTYTDTYMSQVM